METIGIIIKSYEDYNRQTLNFGDATTSSDLDRHEHWSRVRNSEGLWIYVLGLGVQC